MAKSVRNVRANDILLGLFVGALFVGASAYCTIQTLAILKRDKTPTASSVSATPAHPSGQQELEMAVVEAANGMTANLERMAAANVAQAIVERRVIGGMTALEVKQSRGLPDAVYEGGNISDNLRQAGGVQIWFYEQYSGKKSCVLFDRYGKVIIVGDWLAP